MKRKCEVEYLDQEAHYLIAASVTLATKRILVQDSVLETKVRSISDLMCFDLDELDSVDIEIFGLAPNIPFSACPDRFE